MWLHFNCQSGAEHVQIEHVHVLLLFSPPMYGKKGIAHEFGMHMYQVQDQHILQMD